MVWTSLLATVLKDIPSIPSGASGWVTALVTAGSGGSIIVWLLWKFLPTLMADHKAIITSKDAIIQSLLAKSEEDRKQFQLSLNEVLKHCEQETGKMAQAVREEVRLLHRQ